ncbi:unnamed protein product [Rhizoctonia solani]|uniref:HAT C-terminal dimerisation domain-containing protein n=1 Tax=Rhizoctonia solani TaxID=456999 RepID=A0A8H3AAM7_9AGAM|nr:unnamed protein product [Rhizoctonia solani]CAE6478209.1 unnamed protein product [Rhizoctonia solani]
MRIITRSLGIELRAVIKSVPTRWNSVLAEVRRAIKLKAAFNQYVAKLDEGVTGAKLRAARSLKKKWTITDEEWDALEELVRLLEPFESATQDYSKRGRSVLNSVLLTYASLQEKLAQSRELYRSQGDPFGMLDALDAGEAKLKTYFNLARESDLTLIASILHPGIRLACFLDINRWGDLATRGRTLMDYLYETYKIDVSDTVAGFPTDAPQPQPAESHKRGWIDDLLATVSNPSHPAFEELVDYFNGKYQYKCGDILIWWKEHEVHFPVLSRIARDFLAIPATSVSVEQLFSRCKLVVSDYRNMSSETARQLICSQQWLEAGLGVDLPDFVLNN